LSNAAREILRIGDLVDSLLRLVPQALSRPDKACAEQATRLGRQLDMLHAAVKRYLSHLERGDLTERDAIRLSDLLEFAVNLGQAGDILERRVGQLATRRDDLPDEADREALLRIHASVCTAVRLAISTMMTEDERSARELLDAKRAINDAERAATREHLARLAGANDSAHSGSSLFLATLSDLRLVSSHLSSIGYAALSTARWMPPPAGPVVTEIVHKALSEQG
jgi:phosphate:Na+ symporter